VPDSTRVALVSGAGGAIGGAIARRLHRDGFTLFAIDLSAERLGTLSDELGGVATAVVDVTDAEQVESAVAAAAELGEGHVQVLVNATGVSDGAAALDEMTDDMWDRVMNANLRAFYLTSNRTVKHMIGSGGGVILNIASVAGLRGGRSGIAYTASKWAVVGLSQNTASSLGPEGIRSHAICPSRIEGVFTLGQGIERTPRGYISRDRDTMRPPAGNAEDVANVAGFLASDDSKHLNGLAVPVDGGWLAY
jgi:NAD(P)-dependent dehydrogenase (short-subunit alcohol dehydrogenase family)